MFCIKKAGADDQGNGTVKSSECKKKKLTQGSSRENG